MLSRSFANWLGLCSFCVVLLASGFGCKAAADLPEGDIL